MKGYGGYLVTTTTKLAVPVGHQLCVNAVRKTSPVDETEFTESVGIMYVPEASPAYGAVVSNVGNDVVTVVAQALFVKIA